MRTKETIFDKIFNYITSDKFLLIGGIVCSFCGICFLVMKQYSNAFMSFIFPGYVIYKFGIKKKK